MTEIEYQAHLADLAKARRDRYYLNKRKQAKSATIIKCACGCGTDIKSVDEWGRKKSFVSSHTSKRKYDDPLEYKRVYARKRYTDPILKQQMKQKKLDRHRSLKSKLIILKGGECMKCKVKYDKTNGAIFQFHHRDPNAKEDRIKFWWSWTRILKEAEKCDLVCGNCHSLIHSGRY